MIGGRRSESNEGGFTLIELLVVIVIIAILAAIAIPIYINQREKAYVSSIQHTLKNVSTYIESFSVDFQGDYSALDEQPAAVLSPEGYRHPDWATAPGYVEIQAEKNRYCIEAQHKELSPANEWRRSTYDSNNPRPVETPDVCPNLVP